MAFYVVNIQDIDLFWPQCKEILKSAFRGLVHRHSVDDYYEPLKEGAMQLWVAGNDNKIDGAVVTSLEQGSQAKACQIFSLAGESLKDWVSDMDRTLTEFAKANDCQVIEAITRQGFSRFVPDFVEDGRLYVKVIKGEK